MFYMIVCGRYYLLASMLDFAAIEQHKLEGNVEVIKGISNLAISTIHARRASWTAVIQYEADLLNSR